jgi:inorganic triphosphatase YgiF
MTEVELKLSLEPSRAPGLRRHPLLAGTKPVTRHLHSVYLDTPAWDLMGRGMAFRVRKAGSQWMQTLKAEAASVGALTRRPEWEVGLPRGHHDLDRLPPEALALLKGVDVDLIGPAFATDFRRTTWAVRYGEAEMEVALDVGVIQAGVRSMPLCEVEIELKAGPREALFDVALALLARTPMGVEPRSKAARGYALAGAVTPAPMKALSPPLDKDMPAGQAWALLAEAALAQVVGNVPGFLSTPEEIEYLHQLRIGLRRLRTMVGLAAGIHLAEPAWNAALKGVMEDLNGARDWDVLMAQTLPRLLAVLEDAPPGPALARHLAREAAAARATAQAAIAAPAFTRLVLEIGRDLLTPPPCDDPLRHWAAASLEARWQRLLKRGRDFDRLDAAQRHRLRIAAKRLRYTADVLGSAFTGTHGFMTRLGRLQDRLGALQDNVVASRLLAGLKSRSDALLFDAGRLMGVLAGEREGQGQGGGKAWRALSRSRPFWRAKAGVRSRKH